MTLVPDASVMGLTGQDANPLRYGDGSCDDPSESPGIIRSFMPSDASVLDVGCGGGGYTVELNRGKNNRVLCIEPDPERAAAARAKGLTVQEGVLDEAFAASGRKFDVILFGDVLEHVVDPGRLLQIARSCLTPEGRIIVSVPNVAHWTVRLKLLIGKFNYAEYGIMDATHIRWFTRKTLLSMLSTAGLEPVEVRHSAGLWLWEYQRAPLRIIPAPLRRAIVLRLLAAFPTLMGLQHVVNTRVASATGAG